MRQISIAPGEFYHIFNRGMRKQEIFRDEHDRWRFLFLLLHFQSALTFNNISHDLATFIRHHKRHPVSGISKAAREKMVAEVATSKSIGLLAFALMPNHFHLLIKEKTEGGISAYMQRVLNAYTKYFNAKYGESGHLFQGPFQIVHVADNDQLLYTSAYIHRNCCELPDWGQRPLEYLWSSYQDYAKQNRWPGLCDPLAILEQFDQPHDKYHDWVEGSGAKEYTEHRVSFIENG